MFTVKVGPARRNYPLINEPIPFNKDLFYLWASAIPSLMKNGGYVYIMTNKYKTTLYIGVTSNLRKRVLQHRQHFYPNGFTAKYNLTYCIYYEYFSSIQDAIDREKELKKWRRAKKDTLINNTNPDWNDLWNKIRNW